MEMIEKFNTILAFADDNLIIAQNIFDVKRAVDCISIEIRKMGLEINPEKCSLLMVNIG